MYEAGIVERSLALVKEPRSASVLFTFGLGGKVRELDSDIACATVNGENPSNFSGPHFLHL